MHGRFRDKSRRNALLGAGMLFAFGLVMLLEAHWAQVHHTLLRFRGRMDPWLGYLGAILFFAVSAYGFYLAFRRNGSDNSKP